MLIVPNGRVKAWTRQPPAMPLINRAGIGKDLIFAFLPSVRGDAVSRTIGVPQGTPHVANYARANYLNGTGTLYDKQLGTNGPCIHTANGGPLLFPEIGDVRPPFTVFFDCQRWSASGYWFGSGGGSYPARGWGVYTYSADYHLDVYHPNVGAGGTACSNVYNNGGYGRWTRLTFTWPLAGGGDMYRDGQYYSSMSLPVMPANAYHQRGVSVDGAWNGSSYANGPASSSKLGAILIFKGVLPPGEIVRLHYNPWSVFL